MSFGKTMALISSFRRMGKPFRRTLLAVFLLILSHLFHKRAEHVSNRPE